jgi:hypothetical protein
LTSRSSGRLVAGALILALALPGRAAGTEVKLWPLFRYARDDARGLVRWSALGPLLEFTRTPETRDLRIRPFLWLRQRRGPTPDDRADILYPLAASRWEEGYQSFRLLLFTYRTSPRPGAAHPAGQPPPPAEWTSRFTLMPFVAYRRSPERGRSLSVFPFWLDEEGLLGYQRVSALLFPAYLRLEEPGIERHFYGFPFVSRVTGARGSGFRLWPVYGETHITGQRHTRYVAWPFHIRSRQLVPGYGWEERRIDLPAFAAIDGAGRRSRSYGLLAYLHTVDERTASESTGAPWPFVVRERGLGEDEYRTWRLFPFYGRSQHGGVSSRFYAWPAYRTKVQDVEDFYYQRRDVGLVLWRQQAVDSRISGRQEQLLTVFPALRSQREDGRRFGQVPALADSLLPRNRGVLALWAPLYGLVRWDTRPDGDQDWNVGWGLVAREDGDLLGPLHLDVDRAESADGG